MKLLSEEVDRKCCYSWTLSQFLIGDIEFGTVTRVVAANGNSDKDGML